MRPRGLLLLASLMLCATLATSCSSSEDDEFPLVGTTLSISDIAGNWTATQAVFSRAAAGPVLNVDLLAAGATVTLGIQTNGRFTLTATLPGEAPDVTTGQLGFDEDVLVVIDDDDPGDFERFSITASATTLSIQGPSTFDFDGDGTEEAAVLVLDFVRS